MDGYKGPLKDVTDYRTVEINGKWVIVLTAGGKEYLDRDFDGNVTFDTKSQAKEYCRLMMMSVNLVHKRKK